MNFVRFLIFLTCLSLMIFSCKTGSRDETEATTKVHANVENLDQELFASKSVNDVQSFLNKHSYLAPLYFADAQADPSQLAGRLYNILQNPDFRTFRSQVDSIIGNRDSVIIKPLNEAFGRIKSHYPNFKAPAVKFIMTGFTGNDLYISDSLIIIGLDYFGGPKANYRPDVFDYQLRKYQKEYIVPSIIFFMSNKYNHVKAGDASLLAEMIGYGKAFEFVKQILPKTPESVILGYSEDNLKRTYNSQQEIWSFFITNKLLYENNELKKQKFIGERPFTTEIGNKVPGGIARWFGWRIVQLYMKENQDLTLPELMQKDNATVILQESGYKGQKDEEE